jgi:hypothetical protein
MGSYYPSGSSTVNPLVFTIPLARTMNDTSYKSALAVEQLYGNLNSAKNFNITFALGPRAMGSFSLNIYSSSMNLIQSMKFRYMVIASSWGIFVSYWNTESVNTFVSSTMSYTWTNTGLNAVNMSGTVKTFSVLTGFDVTATTPIYLLCLKLTTTRISSTTLQGVLTSSNSIPTLLNQISFIEITVNVGEISAIPGRMTIGTISGTNSGSMSFVDSAGITRDYNTICGLQGFQLRN